MDLDEEFEKIVDLRNAMNNNKLIIFVGSGVSANSNLPTWGELIQKFADTINYNTSSSRDKTLNTINNSSKRDKFNPDEFLKIPEYCYCTDKRKYQELVQSEIVEKVKTATPNPIHESIYKLTPAHIVTTNFDELLENTEYIKYHKDIFSVVHEDRDLFKKTSKHYIIKMHGDITAPEQMVFKETDFLEYEQTHPLITAYIKSLLINHTFLFLGYSLNDPTLKIILGWVNHLAKKYSVGESKDGGKTRHRSRYYLLETNSSTTSYERKYYETYNLSIISSTKLLGDIPEELVELFPDERGKEIYRLLFIIYSETLDKTIFSPLNVIYSNLQYLKGYNKISHDDFVAVSKFKGIKIVGSTLYFPNSDEYSQLRKALELNNKKANFIKSILKKTGITQIQIENQYGSENQFTILASKSKKTVERELFNLYLQNNYTKIKEQLLKVQSPETKAYYMYMLDPHSPLIQGIMKEIAVSLNKSDEDTRFLHQLFYKYNLSLLKIAQQDISAYQQVHREINAIIDSFSVSQSAATVYIQSLINRDNSRTYELKEQCRKQHELYEKKTLVFPSNEYGVLEALKTKIYNYYFYSKNNYLYHEYTDTLNNTYYDPYEEAILCTYMPKEENKGNSIFPYLASQYGLKEYPLSEIDVDIFVKYSSHSKLINWFDKYSVKELRYTKNPHLSEKFRNLCQSFESSSLNILIHQEKLKVFVELLLKSKLTQSEKETIIASITSLTRFYVSSDSVMNILLPILVKLVYFIPSSSWDNLLECVINLNLLYSIKRRRVVQQNYRNLLYLLKKYDNKLIQRKINKLLNNADRNDIYHYIYYLRFIIQRRCWFDMLQENYNQLDNNELTEAIIGKFIQYHDTMQDRYLEEIKKHAEFQKNNPRKHYYPDPLERSINNYILLYIIGTKIDISLLKPYQQYSVILEFLLNQNTFDYNKVDLSYFMWGNIIRNERYRPILKEHIDEILTDELKSDLRAHRLTEEDEKMIYQYLLDWNCKGIYSDD